MKEILIKQSEQPYPIWIGSHILSTWEYYQEQYDKILLLSNKTLAKLYPDFFSSFGLQEKQEIYLLEDGEEYKNLVEVQKIYSFLIEKGFSRKSLILCLGGGVVCDLGGFVAASFLRGIDFIQIPTSLLAQVDASIGGKVAVNHPQGKNLIGFFYPPKAVIIDVDFLDTLDEDQFRSGMAEVIKHSILSKGQDYFSFLQAEARKILAQEKESLISLVYQSCCVKKYFVETDPQEQGVRAFLNLGHTYAHAIEKLFHYQGISHGLAVAKGLLFDLYLSWQEGKISKEFYEDLQKLFAVYGIDGSPIHFALESLWMAMKKDKKNSFDRIKTIGLEIRGKEKIFSLREVPKDSLQSYLHHFATSYPKAVIDIGTNSCRLLIAPVKKEKSEKQIQEILYQDVQIVQLGEKVHETGFLQESAIQRCIHCLQDYANKIQEFACLEVYCFATSATRDAKNRESFIEKVYQETGILIHCIAGDTEAQYSYLGVSQAFPHEPVFVIDIGGGSTEFTIGENGKILFQKSLNIGAVRATELFFPTQDYSSSQILACRKWIREHLESLSFTLPKGTRFVAVAGTASTQISVREAMEVYDRKKVHLSSLSQEDLGNNLQTFLALSLEERKQLKGLESKRANVIIAGSLILEEILHFLGENEIRISEYDNLMGAMLL